MFIWQKLGLVFNPAAVGDRPWLHSFAQAPASLQRDSALRMYFSCRPPADPDGQFVSYSAWVDLDPADPTRVLKVADAPILSLGELGTFDEFGTYPVSVISRNDEIWAYYGGWTRCRSVPFNVAIGVAVSRDGGVSFERRGPGPVIGYSPYEPFVMSGPKIRRFGDLFYLFYIAGRSWKMADGRAEPVYRIRMATSRDGFQWHKHGRDLIPPRIEPDEAQASPDVHFHNGRYHMFFCYRYSTGYRGHERGYRIGYAHSTDLVNWHRDDTLAGLHPSQSGWDSEMVSYPHVFMANGETYVAYLGNGVGRDGFGLARLQARP
ncbi:glycosylase [Seohaeicola saemankumensis]|uniref:glycosylase n=1 Tax=Seohaeicola TaxID=481178 RepID=UPI0035CF1A29